jgi:hypothetical protein
VSKNLKTSESLKTSCIYFFEENIRIREDELEDRKRELKKRYLECENPEKKEKIKQRLDYLVSLLSPHKIDDLERRTSCCNKKKKINGKNGFCQDCVGESGECNHPFKHEMIFKAINEGLSKKNKENTSPSINPQESIQIYQKFQDINARLLQQKQHGGVPVKALVGWIKYLQLNTLNAIYILSNFVRFHDKDISKPDDQKRVVHLKYSVVLKYNAEQRQKLTDYLLSACDVTIPDEINMI